MWHKLVRNQLDQDVSIQIMKPTPALLALFMLAQAAQADESPLWLRYPAISPDGQTIAFEWKGDIYSVPASGGKAVPLTLSESYEFAPRLEPRRQQDRLCV